MQGWYPSRDRRYFSSPKCPDQLWGLLLSGYWRSFTIVKQLWHDIDHSPPANLKVKNEGNCTSATPHMCYLWHGQRQFYHFYHYLAWIHGHINLCQYQSCDASAKKAPWFGLNSRLWCLGFASSQCFMIVETWVDSVTEQWIMKGETVHENVSMLPYLHQGEEVA